MDTYYRLILTSSGQTTYSSPVYTNLNFPDLSPFNFCKIFVESCGLSVAEESGAPAAERAHDFVTIELADYASSNTQICNGSNTSNSSILDVISGELENITGGNDVVKCNKNKTSDIIMDGAIFPINVLQNNGIKLHIRYADNSLVVEPPTPHNQYKIILQKS